jgi:hypothetical protein
MAISLNGTLTDGISNLSFSAASADHRHRPSKLQAIVWVSFTPRDPEKKSLDDSDNVFPSVLDTGCNVSFLLHQWHLKSWADCALGDFKSVGAGTELYGCKCPTIGGDLWLHEHYGLDPPADKSSAVKLQMSGGASVSSICTHKVFQQKAAPDKQQSWPEFLSDVFERIRQGRNVSNNSWIEEMYKDWDRRNGSVPPSVYPRIPLVGMRILAANKLILTVVGKANAFHLES